MSSKSNEPHLTGLTDQEVLKSREQHGVNLLTPPNVLLSGNFTSKNFRTLSFGCCLWPLFSL